jgi:hypothetical protein
VHFVKEGEFDEIRAFRQQIEETYGIVILLFGPDFKTELQKLLDQHNVKAVIMGNRVTDPYSADLSSL